MNKYALLASTMVLSSNLHAADLEFEISGVKTDQGKIYVQLFKGKDNYQASSAEASSIVKADKNTLRLNFNDLAEGHYALRYFHDSNGNQQMDTNLFGLPTEGYGFSNDAKPNFGPVEYERAAFEVSGSKVINRSVVVY